MAWITAHSRTEVSRYQGEVTVAPNTGEWGGLAEVAPAANFGRFFAGFRPRPVVWQWLWLSLVLIVVTPVGDAGAIWLFTVLVDDVLTGIRGVPPAFW